jgi:hypothetical protein
MAPRPDGGAGSRTAAWLTGAALVALALSTGVKQIRNPDYWWHLRTGYWIAETGSIPRGDIFTYTVPGAQWIDIHWLFQLVLAGVHALVGRDGAVLVKAFLGVALVAILATMGWRRERPWVTGLALGLMLLGGALVTAIYVGGMISDGRARERLAHTLPELEREFSCNGIHFAAHWSFQHHAERLGYPPISGASTLERGDCIAVVEGFPRQAVRLRLSAMAALRVVGVRSGWPWSSAPSYFGGPIPLRPQPRWQGRLTLYRVEREGVIVPAPPATAASGERRLARSGEGMSEQPAPCRTGGASAGMRR